MNNNTTNYIPSQEELTRIKNIKDEDIDLSEAPETDAECWQNAQKFSKKTEQNLVLLDADIAQIFPDNKSVNDALRLLINVARSSVK
ncbi:hypothetical protein [Geminocystis herdmanii]|uniref:hypothetical protein n=1 Tax=Geminocystis herdmanii TaxID=669359 RepID=UPI000349C3AA|nr:hypothetical protein [Geminocystis herdmanii]